jgi:hypothetical protein
MKIINCTHCNEPLNVDEVEICSLCLERYNEMYDEDEAKREEINNFLDERYREQRED